MFIAITVLIALTSGGQCLVNRTSADANNNVTPNSQILIESIRRQLMESNYDYDPSDEERPGSASGHPTARVHETTTENKPAGQADNRLKQNIYINDEITTSFYPKNKHNDLTDDVVKEVLLSDIEDTADANEDELKNRVIDTTPKHDIKLLKDDHEKYKAFQNTYAKPHSPSQDDKAGKKRSFDFLGDINLRAQDSSQKLRDSNEDLNSRIDRIHHMVDKIENNGKMDSSQTKLDTLQYAMSHVDGPDFRREKQSYNSKEGQKPQHAVSKNDLLYYVDDERLARRANGPPGKGVDFDDAEDDEAIRGSETHSNTSTVKYRVVQIRKRHPTRRHSQVRKFVEERAEDGVTFIKLDGDPFPQFRLPRSRRQYMANDDDILTDTAPDDPADPVDETDEGNTAGQQDNHKEGAQHEEGSEDGGGTITLERQQEEELRRHLLNADKEFQDALQQLKNVT